MASPIANTGVAITNPLVLYRALVATNRISPDPSQHRLAIHLQKLYDRLKDYEPTVEYKHRLAQLTKAVGGPTQDAPSPSLGQRGIWQSLLAQKEARDSLALTRTLTSHEAALSLDSPKGLMLHGEVGTGKSMLIDLFADCLPNRKKARWHFNTFMLSVLSQLERLRRDRLRRRLPASATLSDLDDHSLLWLAREMINTSPILFLDEFQLPDRAASKIMTGLMTSFFQLGGVLIATSNRMPEELHKAAGMTFAAPPTRMDSLTYRLGLGGGRRTSGIRSDNEFGGFLDVLKARCEVWEMQGGKDYRRQEVDFQGPPPPPPAPAVGEEGEAALYHLDLHQDLQNAPGHYTNPAPSPPTPPTTPPTEAPEAPKNYLIRPSSTAPDPEKSTYASTLASLSPLLPKSYTPSTLKSYGRTLHLPLTSSLSSAPETLVLKTSFAGLCSTTAFGPADYISLASTYSIFILTEVPVLGLLQKNEARRFITFLDAAYECRCKLLILDAEAGPDELFFPDKKGGKEGEEEGEGGVYAETFSEAYQDVTAPFRPNISSQTPEFADEYEPQLAKAVEEELEEEEWEEEEGGREEMLPFDALEDTPPNRARRQSMRDGEVGPIDPDDDVLLRNTIHRPSPSRSNGGKGKRKRGRRGGKGLDFGRTGAFTGEDEKFAFKRAQSRLWEMCSGKWWDRSSEDWHRPLPKEVRGWEGSSSPSITTGGAVYLADQGRVVGSSEGAGEGIGGVRSVDEKQDEVLFRHGASPFRTSREPPPKFSWTHVWGTMQWGKKAGAWGKGVEGLEERKAEVRRMKEEGEKETGKKKE